MRFSHNIERGFNSFYCGFTFLNILPRKFHQSSFFRVIESVDYVLGIFSCDDGTINGTRKKPF